MPKQYINPKELFPSLQYGFSQIVTSEPGSLVFVSGQVGWDENQSMPGTGDFRTQTWQAFRNIGIAVSAVGGTMSDVVSLRIYIVEAYLTESNLIQEALKEFFPPGEAPATTWIGVRALANKDFLIEIEAMAVLEG